MKAPAHLHRSHRHRRRLLISAGAAALGSAGAALVLAPQRARAQGAAANAGSAAADPAAQEAKAPPLPAVGSRFALPASLELLDGQRFDTATQADGRVLVLYWWASWCPFCALTSPHVDKLWREQRARDPGRGLRLLTLSIDRRPDEARAHLRRHGYEWPAAWMSPALQQVLPKPRGLPVTLVRGRDGRVLQAEAGQLFPEDVEALARHVAG
ncbi:MAG: TlpA family protein disulfide reductase [Rubrivivax sp.]|nr:TlpA family protein disulfide reductase [Rubrivivax sp.]